MKLRVLLRFCWSNFNSIIIAEFELARIKLFYKTLYIIFVFIENIFFIYVRKPLLCHCENLYFVIHPSLLSILPKNLKKKSINPGINHYHTRAR